MLRLYVKEVRNTSVCKYGYNSPRMCMKIVLAVLCTQYD